ncbi:hypothetical protein NOCA2300015 [metagenome]|uniref:Uncharacterized protein n=1 Tax=metagenome TaxID=256318 RepID=A0A2P2C192_9ZZZZ
MHMMRPSEGAAILAAFVVGALVVLVVMLVIATSIL